MRELLNTEINQVVGGEGDWIIIVVGGAFIGFCTMLGVIAPLELSAAVVVSALGIGACVGICMCAIATG